VYLDSSALVKLTINEPETSALAAFLASRPGWVSSSVAKVELLRVARRTGVSLITARELVDRVALVPIDDDVLEQAALLQPTALRTLDAIHAATALRVRDRLGGVVTYDARLKTALSELGLRVLAPA
jgi:uncharacterized protein